MPEDEPKWSDPHIISFCVCLVMMVLAPFLAIANGTAGLIALCSGFFFFALAIVAANNE